MKKLLLILAMLLLLPLGAKADCDLSLANINSLAQANLDTLYSYNPLGLKKPNLIVSPRKVKGYYAEELHGTITIYPKALRSFYCDQYFDGLTPFVKAMISHEYTHYLDEKLHLSQKTGSSAMSEKTANWGEHVFDQLIWHTGYATGGISNAKNYNKLLGIISL